MKDFSFHIESEDLRRERAKARELRQSQWWKRRLAKGICHWCGRSFAASELTMDHIVPMARGGLSTKGNVVPCCKECNNQKKQLLPMEWEAYLESRRAGREI
ncbi:MAG: HNH endonuclease [Desulfobacterales bacterium]|nr:HNH endonuclease [Desulfobacterales bacterium]